jgi:peptidyl-prolyl cis-trans isomerase A (cyclophilin A)
VSTVHQTVKTAASLIRRALQPAAIAAIALACSGAADDSRGASTSLASPDSAALATAAPDTFRVEFTTSEGTFVVEAYRDWAPHGVDRFHDLVQMGFFNETRFFRVLKGFMAQFGINGNPDVNSAWDRLRIPDDSVRESNERGAVSFAMAGPGTRTTQLFINYVDNSSLDAMGFAPIGRVVEGMEVVDSLYGGYGEGPPGGFGPDQGRLMEEGTAYAIGQFPRLSVIHSARIVP